MAHTYRIKIRTKAYSGDQISADEQRASIVDAYVKGMTGSDGDTTLKRVEFKTLNYQGGESDRRIFVIWFTFEYSPRIPAANIPSIIDSRNTAIRNGTDLDYLDWPHTLEYAHHMWTGKPDAAGQPAIPN